jgi:two-component system, NarL family, invasion response regulator UvrY
MANRHIRVLVVDDHAVVRSGFVQLVEAADAMEVVAEAGTASDALTILKDCGVDVVLLDISLPDAPVLETVAKILAETPQVGILIVSIHSEDQYATNLMRAGVRGYFSKAQAGGELIEAIRTVAAGRKYISKTLANSLALAASGDTPPHPHHRLSKRETEVFLRLAMGDSVTYVADDMGLSVKTTSTFRTRILEKMGFERNAEITAYAMQHALLQ